MNNSEINLEEYNKKSIEYWEGFFGGVTTNEIKYDDWLERFQNEINNCKTPIIDLGCGIGNDTKYLIEKGKEVIPCDFSPIAIQNINKNFPEIKKTEVFDMTEGLPFEDNYTELIIADLSIHYFIEKVTFFILDEIKRVLKPNGVLLFRVNSINDTNYGAGSGKEIEHHLYEVSIQNGSLKRFFDKEDIDRFFEGWKILYLNEDILRRFLPEKKLWTGAVQVIK